MLFVVQRLPDTGVVSLWQLLQLWPWSWSWALHYWSWPAQVTQTVSIVSTTVVYSTGEVTLDAASSVLLPVSAPTGITTSMAHYPRVSWMSRMASPASVDIHLITSTVTVTQTALSDVGPISVLKN